MIVDNRRVEPRVANLRNAQLKLAHAHAKVFGLGAIGIIAALRDALVRFGVEKLLPL